MTRTYTFRLTSEGVEALQQQLTSLGPAGEAAFGRIKAAAPSMASAIENAQARAAAASKKLADQARADFSGLTATLSPAIAAQQDLAKGREVISTAQARGVATDAQAAQAMALLEQRYGTATRAGATFTEGVGIANRALGAFGIALGVQQIVSFGKAVFDNAASLDAQARAAGTSTAALQARRAVLKDANIDAQEADALTKHLTRSIGEATGATGAQRSAFVELGLSAKDLAGGTDAVFPKVAAALLQIQDAGTRARLENDLFQRSGQDLEAALTALIDPTSTLIEKQTALGHVMGDDLTAAADKAQREMQSSWDKLEVGLTPIIVNITELLSGLIGEMAGIAAFPGAVLEGARAAKAGGKIVYGQPAPTTGAASDLNIGAIGSTDTSSLFPDGAAPGQIGQASRAPGFGGTAPDFDAFLAKSKQAADLASLSATERAKEEATIGLANALLGDGNATLKDSSGQLVKQVDSYAQARDLLDKNGQSAARITVETQAQTAEAAKQAASLRAVKTNFDQYLASQVEAARVAGESSADREDELALVRGAQAVQKSRRVDENALVQTYGQALRILTDQQQQQILAEQSAKRVAAITQAQVQQIDLLNVGLAADADHRALAVKNAQDELAAGKGLTDEQRKQIDNNNQLIQQKQDLQQFNDTIAQMQEEVSLAGMSADEREREAAVLRAMHQMHGNLSADQADEVRQLTAARQQAEKIGQAASSFENDFVSAFAEIGDKGKDAWGDLTDSLRRDWKQLLAWMIEQAIAQPIIVPIVQSMVGSAAGIAGLLGGGTSGGLLGATGSLGGLGSLGSLGSLGGASAGGGVLGGISNWIGGGINSLGSALGFGTTMSGLGAASGVSIAGGAGFLPMTGSLSGLSGVLPGTSSLFGAASLGGVLGGGLTGLGVGGLAGSLLGENGLGSNVGGLIGGALGSIIPGIGTIVGSLAGGLIGGLFGPGKSAGKASATFDAEGNVTGFGGDKATQKSSQAVQDAATQVSSVVTALEGAGVQLTNTISKLVIADNRDQSFVLTGDGQQLNVGKVGDAKSAIAGTLNYLLSGASSSDANVNAVLQHYAQNGGITSDNINQVGQDIDFAKSIEQLGSAQHEMNGVATAIKSVTDQFDDAITRAKALGLETSGLIAEENREFQQVVQQYKDAVTAAQANLANVQASFGPKLVKSVSEAQSELQQASSAAAADLNATISKYGDAASALREYSASIAPGGSNGAALDAGTARAQFAALAAQAKSGNTEADAKLSAAGDALIAATQNTAGTANEVAIVRAEVKAAVDAAALQADSRASTALKQLDALSQLVNTQNAMNQNVVTVAQAIDDLNAANAAESANEAAQIAAARDAVTAALANLAQAQAAAAGVADPAAVQASVAGAASAAVTASGVSSNDNITPVVNAAIARHVSTLKATRNIPVSYYADGGDFDPGWAIVGEQGPELVNFSSTGHVFDAQRTRGMLDGDGAATRAAIEALTREVMGLRRIVTQILGHSDKTARNIENVLGSNGNAFQVEEAA